MFAFAAMADPHHGCTTAAQRRNRVVGGHDHAGVLPHPQEGKET